MTKKITQDQVVQDNLWQNTIDSTNELIKVVDKLDASLKSVAKDSKAALSGQSKDNFRGLKGADEEVNKLNKAFAEKLKIDKQRLKLQSQLKTARLAELKLQKDREKAFDRADKQEKTAIKNAQKLRKTTSDNANAFKILTKQVNSAQARFKRLAAQYGETDKRTQKALSTFNKLDTRLRSINNTARDGRRDVGRYGLALKSVGGGIKSLLFAGGVVGAIQGIGRAIGDAFDRVRDFDRELQNIAGVTGIAREDLKSLEKDIISVAGASIRTSNEVAKLASTLFTLGNSEREVRLLLKPVNDLSIALGTTSEEAADFLGQTLNAFGKGAKSGQEFADIIANVRVSTSLDFQRIKDALGFVAPTANALGLSLGEISAQIGVLQDNGIKAARAGRLLNSSFARLIEKGLSLEDALLKINTSQDKILTATQLFGKESFTLGLILADNTEKTAALANEFDNLSEGSLKTLTDSQLEGLGAKLLIVESAYERLILKIENGEGRIGKAAKVSLDALAKLINLVADGEKTRTSTLREQGEARSVLRVKQIEEESKSEEELQSNLKNNREKAAIDLRSINKDVADAQRELFTQTQKHAQGAEISLKDIQKAFKGDVLGLKSRDDRGLAAFVTSVEDLNTANTKVSLAVANRIFAEELLLALESELLDVEKERVEVAEEIEGPAAKRNKERIGNIARETSLLSKLKTELKAVNEARELIVFTKGSEEAFQELTKDAEKLSNQIQIIQDKLAGKEDPKKKINANRRPVDGSTILKEEKERLEKEAAFEIANRERTLDILRALNDKFFRDQQLKADEQIVNAHKRESELRNLAAQGNEDAAASLAQNQKDQAEAAKKKADLLQKEKQAEFALSVIQSFNAELDNGKTVGQALGTAGTTTLGLTALINSLPSFFDGTTDTGSNGSLDSNGGHMAMLHDNERVVDKKNNSKMGGVSNDLAADIVHDFNNDLLSYNTPQLTVQKSNWDSNEKVLQKFDELKKDIVGAINNKETYLGSDVDTFKKLILQDYQKGGTRTTVKSKYPTRR